MAALRAAAGGFRISPSGPMPDCEVLAALVPERVLPFASGGSRKRRLEPSPSGPKSLFGNRGGAPKGERARSRGSPVTPVLSPVKRRGTEPRRAPHRKVRYPAVRLSAPCLPSLWGGVLEWLGAAKLGCGGVAGTD